MIKNILKHYQPVRRRLVFLLIISWVLLNILPFSIVLKTCKFQFEICPMVTLGKMSFFLALVALLILAIESYLLFSLTRWIKQYYISHNSLLSSALFYLFFVFLWLYSTLLILSWLYHSVSNKFLSLEDLYFLKFFSDWNTLQTVLSKKDARQLLAAIAGGLILTAAILFCTPFRFNSVFPKTGRKLFSVSLISLILARLWIGLALPVNQIIESQQVASLFVSPRLSYGWSRILLGKTVPTYTEVELDLEPIAEGNPATKVSKRSKNIILFVVESLRTDALAAAGGNSNIVPTLNSLASEGKLFPNSYAQSTETGYSMFSLITGLYPLTSEARDFRTNNNYPFIRIYDLLSDAGYRTAYLTFEWEVTRAITLSDKLDLSVDPQAVPTAKIIEKLPSQFAANNPLDSNFVPGGDKYNIETLKEWISSENKLSNKPFFAMVYLYSSHFAYAKPKSSPAIFQPTDIPTDVSFLSYPKALEQTMRNRYYNSLNWLDSQILEVKQLLDQSKLDQDTVIIVTGDHGELFHEHGAVTHTGSLHQEAVNVPIVVWGAEDFYPKKGSSAAIEHIDLTASILSLADLPKHPNIQGKTFLYRDPERKIPEPKALFMSIQVSTHEDATIVWPWKFIKNYRGFGERMFNLETDPKEQENLLETELEKAAVLREILQDYRNRQLSYYDNRNLYKKRFYQDKYQLSASQKKILELK